MGAVATTWALIQNGVSVGGAITAALGLGPVAASVLRIGGSLLVSAALSNIGARRMKQAEVAARLALPSTIPPYRFVYGETRAVGTPCGLPVKGAYIYGCWLLNSRPSAGPFVLYLDEREVVATGDPYDFTGPGAAAVAEPFVGHVNYWVQRGEKASPPDVFLDEAPWSLSRPDLWLASDGWRGRTVIWLRLKVGSSRRRQERWPAYPPQVKVYGKWSRIWNPRNPAQDPNLPNTWGWSDNAALCLLDVLRHNPVQPWPDRNLDIPMFVHAADVADQVVPLSSGGSEARYECAGTLIFDDAEIEDLVDPLLAAQAGRLVRVGGKLGIVPAVWDPPDRTLTDFLGDEMSMSTVKRGRDMPRSLRVTYTSAERGYETAELAEWNIPGSTGRGTEDLSLEFVTSATQAARVRNIYGRRLAMQRRIEGMAPPEMIDLIAGSTVAVSLPAPFSGAVNGNYEVESIHPAFQPMGSDGAVAMMLPVVLTQTGPGVYAWNPATDEPEIVEQPYNDARGQVPLPGAITAETGPSVDLNTGGTVIPRVRFSFLPAQAEDVLHYEWQQRLSGGDWSSGGLIDGDVRDAAGRVFGFMVVALTSVYDIRVRTVTSAGGSEWRTITGVLAAFVISSPSGTAGTGSATFSGTAPATNYRGFEVYRGPVGAPFSSATLVSSVIVTDPGLPFTETVGGLAAGAASFFLRPVSLTGLRGAPSPAITLTIL